MRNILRYGYIVLALLAMTVFASCSGGDSEEISGGNKTEENNNTPGPQQPDNPDPTPDPSLAPVPSSDPQWTLVKEKEAYECTMTAIVVLPQELAVNEAAADKLSVYAGEECRGVAERVDIYGEHVWMVMIHGSQTEDNTKSLCFKYWSADKQLIYESKPFTFAVDTKLGSIDNPEQLKF